MKALILAHLLLFTSFGLLSSQKRVEFNDIKNQYKRNQSIQEIAVKYINENELNDCLYDFSTLFSGDVKEERLGIKLLVLFHNHVNEQFFKQKSVSLMMDNGLNSSNPDVLFLTLNELLEIPVSSFDTSIRSQLAGKIVNSPLYAELFIHLAGYLKLSETSAYMTSLLENQPSDKIRWQIMLTLGRLGDEYWVDKCINQLRSVEEKNETIDFFYPDLIFLNHPDAFRYLFDRILIDDKNCTSTDPDHEIPMICAFRIIEIIAPHIKNFPVKLLESGDIDTDDYHKSLEIVRKWIIENRESFEIVEN